MDILRHFQNIAWCKPDWCYPSMSKETNELLRQCVDLPQVELSDDIEDIIKKSKAFPIPFPINTVRLEELKGRKSLDKLKRNIVSTYPLIHERVLLLMTHFLIYKREFGSSIEKTFYKDMTVPELIERILKNRAISFLGPHDRYQLITGETGSEGWESVGTLQQKPPLLLENCLSYDEMKLSAMLYVSGFTYCINDGKRNNSGVVDEDGVEEEAVIIGLIGPRFQRRCRMDNEDILITEEQNCIENGYGEEVTPTTCLNVLKTTYVRNNQSSKHMWRQMWSEFYQVHSYTYEELSSYITIHDKDKRYMERYVKKPNSEDIFDNEVYYKRICILAETTLMEAEHRASEYGKNAFINVIGCGKFVHLLWRLQRDLLVARLVRKLVTRLIGRSPRSTRPLRFHSSNETGGVNIQLENREPSSKLSGEHAGKLLVMTYPWDGNAHPGNEFWFGSLKTSGDPAAACSTQVSELHNAHINTTLRGDTVRVAAEGGVLPLREYCLTHTRQ
ncbi:hypothetical protein KGM_212909 [Danaus plexippus plexippus]|uniref:Uncharacterized protein n=1 Tax=Danaus plexippus plexippus TaxID=278856 RepID=A0A212EKN2_DANPL|nr:hypothetical protein KGM_212909 [Danaus plexippus plexippus]